jgi:Heterokaryon incompatibility protein (HET)
MVYEHIDIIRNIRILALHPGGPTEPLSGSLMHHDFSPGSSVPFPRYEALSYEWGSQADSTVIYLAEPYINKEWTARQRDVLPSLSLGARRLRHSVLKAVNLEKKTLQGLCTVRIGHNLAAALRRLRLKWKLRIVWCDSVCTNQDDLDERAAQVRRMAELYKHAHRVIVWLGPATEDDDIQIAVDALATAGRSIVLDVKHHYHYIGPA